MKKNRNSNIEILRIVSIFLVILSHFNVHGNYMVTNPYNININYLLKNIFTTGCFANSIFIIIMGYFMVKSSPNYKKIIKLILDMVFYSYMIGLICISLGLIEINKDNLIKILFPMIYGNWFCVYYIALYMFIPILNYLMNKIEKKDLKKYLILVFTFFSIITTITDNAYMLSNFATFILLYMIGAYISLYIDYELNKKRLYITTIILFTISLSTVAILYFTGIYLKKMNLVVYCNRYILGNSSFFVIIPSIFLFLSFKNTKMNNKKYINYISSSVLGIYLIHDNFIIRNIIWNIIVPNTVFFDKPYFFIFSLLKIIIIFIICLIIDKIKIRLFDNILKKTSSIIEKSLKKTYLKLISLIDYIFKFFKI